jgi:murein DD-endopeptidase MepM/ murein hydrolase activator NlpD
MNRSIYIYIIFNIIFSFSNKSFAQKLNKFGHIIIENNSNQLKTTMNFESGQELIEYKNLLFKGNSAFKIKNGYLSISGKYENTGASIYIYSEIGTEVYTKRYKSIINLKISPSGNYCCFYDGSQLQILNLLTLKGKIFPSATIFDINNNGDVVFYNENKSSISIGSNSYAIEEPVFMIDFFNEKAIFATKNDLYSFENNVIKKIYQSEEGRIFDIQIIQDKMYFTTKQELKDKFIFQLFSTNNLSTFQFEQQSELALANLRNKKQLATPIDSKFHNLTNELIRDPLNFYQDTVYQPIGNSYNEIQEYTTGSPYLHPGVDLLGTYLQDVYSVKQGYVKAIITISGIYHWRIAIANENTADTSQGYLYAHLEQSTIPYQVGDSVNEGDIIGQLVDFPVTGFVHCHFARIFDDGLTWNGSWWTFENPLTYMTNFFDTIPPAFEPTINNDVFAFRDSAGNYLSPSSLDGNVKVISKSFDQINASWHCDVNKLRYSLSPLSNPQTILIDTFAYEYDFYNDNYFSTSYLTGIINTIYSRDISCYTTADYVVRDFYHIVTNSDGNDTIDGNDSIQYFDTKQFANGNYIFRVEASDPSGNTSRDSMIITIQNTGTAIENFSNENRFQISPNPFEDNLNIQFLKSIDELESLTIIDVMGRVVKELNNLNTNQTLSINLSDLKSGVYFVRINFDQEIKTLKIIKN